MNLNLAIWYIIKKRGLLLITDTYNIIIPIKTLDPLYLFQTNYNYFLKH